MSENELVRQVGIGMHVEVELIDAENKGELMAFDLVKEDLGDFDRGLVGANTPLAKAIRGKFVGSVVPYSMGDICRVRIVSVAPLEISAPTDAAERREAVLQKAREDAERTNAEMFASSFTGKWGGYSVDDSEAWDE